MKRFFVMLMAVALMLSVIACGKKMPANTDETTFVPQTQESTTGENDPEEDDTNDALSGAADDVNDPEQVESSDDTAEEEIVEEDTDLIDGMRPDFKEAMDSYESFYNEYCDFMKKYKENPTDLSLLSEYADMMSKATEMSEKLEAWDEDEMNEAELKYYLEVNARVMEKLAGVA